MVKKVTLSVLLLATFGFIWWWRLPEQILKRRTHNFIETISIAPSAALTNRISSEKFESLLAAKVELDIKFRRIPAAFKQNVEKAVLKSNHTQLPMAVKSLEHSITDLNIALASKTKGSAVFNHNIDLVTKKGQSESEQVTTTLYFIFTNGEWKINGITMIPR